VPSSDRLPPSGGASIAGAAHVAEPQDTVKAQLGDETVSGDGVLVTSAATAPGAATQAATGGGFPVPKVLLGGSTNVIAEEVAADDPASSAGPLGGMCSSTEAANDGGAVAPEVILGHPTLRAPRDVSLDEAMHTAHWVLT
jgi:hypothetical protein